MSESLSGVQHVAVAVIPRTQGDLVAALNPGLGADAEVLLGLRPQQSHQGGLWEFPGGKVEGDENTLEALARELDEELGITLNSARPLIQIRHDYHDKSVFLDVWLVEAFSGLVQGREGQKIEWVAIDGLELRDFPAANHAIVNAVRLPVQYFITPEPEADRDIFLETIERVLTTGIRLIQLRVKHPDRASYRKLAGDTLDLCHRYQAELLLNSEPELASTLGADGVHLSSERLMGLDQRPLASDKWVAASCHNEAELRHACEIGADFAVISPVMSTTSHCGAQTLGWLGFRSLAEQATIPVYALGGMTASDLGDAYQNGGQGVAAISSIWKTVSRVIPISR